MFPNRIMDLLKDLKARKDRKLNVQEHEVGLFGLNDTQGRLAVAGRHWLVPHPRHAVFERQDNIRVVVDNEYTCTHGRAS